MVTPLPQHIIGDETTMAILVVAPFLTTLAIDREFFSPAASRALAVSCLFVFLGSGSTCGRPKAQELQLTLPRLLDLAGTHIWPSAAHPQPRHGQGQWLQ